MTKRNKSIDFIKGVLIFCVIWGHTSSTFMGGIMYNLDNWLNLFFCSFHMPLFMGISGYLFYISEGKYKSCKIVNAKLRGLFFPAIIWTLFYSLPACILACLSGNAKDILNKMWNCRYVYWYLWSLLVCSMAMLVCNKVLKKELAFLGIFLIEIVFLLLPTDPLYFAFMWPFFSAGYIWKRMDISVQSIDKRIVLFCTGLFFIMLSQYTAQNTVYVESIPLIYGNIKQLYYALYRILIGLAGGLVISYGCYILRNRLRCDNINKWIELCGENSFALYVLHVAGNYYIGVIVSKVVSLLGGNPLLYNMWIYNLIITPLLSILYTCVLLLIIHLLSSWKLTQTWIFVLRSKGSRSEMKSD